MFQRTMHALAFALVVAAPSAQAERHEKVTDCLDLSAAHTFKRGGSQYLYIADGGQHYRVSFAGGECGEMRSTAQLSFKTGDTADRVCPKDSRLWANGQSCKVNGIEKLSAEDYQRLTRKRRT